jgi:hypothetical protein
MTQPLSYGSQDDSDRPFLSIGDRLVIEYVGGPKPYYWIGSENELIASVEASELAEFVRRTAE